MFDPAFYVYIITNKFYGTLYTGHTDDIGYRMQQHIQGDFKGFAAKYDCKHLVWFKAFETRDAAFKRERQIKAWKRQWKIDLIETDNPNWIDIIQTPVWPLPDKHTFPKIYNDCLSFTMDPNLRWDERKFEDEEAII